MTHFRAFDNPLPTRRLEVLRAIAEGLRTRGRAPSQDTIGRTLGISGRRVQRHREALVDLGFVAKRAFQEWHLTSLGMEALGKEGQPENYCPCCGRTMGGP